MAITGILFALAVGTPAMNQIAVDEAGDRLALRSGPSSVAVYERRGDRWLPLAAGRVQPGVSFMFVGPHFVVGDSVRPLENLRIAEVGTTVEGLSGVRGGMVPMAAGKLAFFQAEPFGFGGPVVVASRDGIAVAATVPTIEEIQPMALAIQTFTGEQIAFVEQRLNQYCRVLVVDDDDGWSRHALFEPEFCNEGGDDFRPLPPQAEAISVAIDGDRLALGTRTNGKFVPGDVVLYRRTNGEWREAGRVARPTLPPDPEMEGWTAHGFGHRVVFAGPRLYIADSWSQGEPSHYYSVNNGVFVMIERDGRWELEKHYMHNTPTATFGNELQVRGERLFVDSPDENAVYVFERRGGEWRSTARVPPEADAEAAGQGD